jgi:hypothetical protein
MLVLDLGARLPEPSADADDQFGQVRSLRTGSSRPVRAVWQTPMAVDEMQALVRAIYPTSN